MLHFGLDNIVKKALSILLIYYAKKLNFLTCVIQELSEFITLYIKDHQDSYLFHVFPHKFRDTLIVYILLYMIIHNFVYKGNKPSILCK